MKGPGVEVNLVDWRQYKSKGVCRQVQIGLNYCDDSANWNSSEITELLLKNIVTEERKDPDYSIILSLGN